MRWHPNLSLHARFTTACVASRPIVDGTSTLMDGIDPRVTDALKNATEAQQSAYAPYSGFKMGAAIVTASGSIVRGSLVETCHWAWRCVPSG